ncbi:hypothetical protein [Streptomyces arenae]|uniref:hypothetical protein n=1 Tax=Streptomyces arenae TaxID=29301 RepID=UPI0026594CA5|nr:hypothetical protein [Streptomyces arenae]MCG7202295.1 hypothetical protein [Streptomyces arenae]
MADTPDRPGLPDELIKLERSAEAERAKLAGLDPGAYEAQRVKWREASAAFHAAVTEYAKREDVTMSRYQLEQAVKRAVRHTREDPAV